MARHPYYGGGGGALGITNPFAQNLPDLATIDKTISEIERNKLYSEDLRSQIEERRGRADQWARDLAVEPETPQQGATTGGGGASIAPGTPFVYANLPQGVSQEEDQLVRTLWGESRGEGARGQQAVAAVIRNRAKQSGKSVQDVIFEPGQFEPWGNAKTRADLEKLDPRSPEYQTILGNLRASQDDPTGGATMFYSPRVQTALGREPPKWGTGTPTAVIGGHNFYTGYGGQPATAQATPVQPPQQRTGPGVPGRLGGGSYDVSGDTVATPGGAPGAPAPPPSVDAASAVAIGAAGRQLLNMPEADAARAYPQVLQQLRDAGIQMPGAPPTYPGHAGVQQMVDRLAQQSGTGAPGAPGASGTQYAGPGVPPPPPPEPTLSNGLTQRQTQQALGMSPTPQNRQIVEQWRAQNFQRKEAYRTNLEQQETQRRLVENETYTRTRQAEQDRIAGETREDTRRRQALEDAQRGIPTGYERDPDNPGAVRFIKNGPADPAVIERNRRAQGAGRGERNLSDTARKELVAAGGQAAAIERLNNEFADYGGWKSGAIGEAANTAARNLGVGDVKGAEWWQQYQTQKNIVRHELFGAALSATEKAEFERADINPGMTNDTIRTNLKRQQVVIRSAMLRNAKALEAGGYNTKQIEAATGIDLDAPENQPGAKTEPAPAAAAPAIPSGWTVKVRP